MSKGSTPRGSHEAYRNAPYWKAKDSVHPIMEALLEATGREKGEMKYTVVTMCAHCEKRIEAGTTCAMQNGRVMHAQCYFTAKAQEDAE